MFRKTGEALTLIEGAIDGIGASVERFVFSDGTELLRRDVLQDVAITGTAGPDSLYGMSWSDEIIDGRRGPPARRGRKRRLSLAEG
ncbi:MAG: hypothetical protein AAGC86_14405 [Pseudomonadota bacterium]